MLDSGKCVTCPEDSTKSGNTCTCNVLGSGTYDSNINKCTYEVCALGVHLENGKCVCDGGTAFNKETKECVATTCTTPDECGCAPYQYMSSDFQCVNCELGYQPDNTQTKQVKCSDVKQSCVSCAAVDSSKPYWNDAAQQCQGCPPYQYKEGTSCKRCPSGKQANDDGTACVACSTLAENRNAECSSCAFYNPKRPYWNAFLNTCTACTLSDQIEENGTCHACPVGMELKASGACECTNCSYNEIYHKCCPTTCSTSADCCAEEGMFCNSGVCSICTGNKVLHDGACVACPAGSTAINNATECQCPAGYQWNASSATCDACPAGYYSQDNVCVECPIGNYIKNNQCLPCTKASAANCEDKPCTEQSHCGGKASQYYCRYTTTNATTDTTTGTGVCKSIGGHTEDRLPTNKRVWYSNIGNLDYWSARNWCIAFGKEPYRCDGMYTETGHDCTGSYQVNMSCPEIIGYTLPLVVYFQSYSNKRAYLSKGTYSASGAVCGGDGGWQYEMAMCQ